MKLPKEVAYIIARQGGDDGVAVMKNHFVRFLNDLNIKVTVFYGSETQKVAYDGNESIHIPELDFSHPFTRWLYQNSFNGVDQGDYRDIFKSHTTTLENELFTPIASMDGPAICHNGMALRHMHPAWARAMQNISRKMSKKTMIDLGPDPSHERYSHLAKQNIPSLEALSRTGKIETSFEGPFTEENIFHLYLNQQQKQSAVQFGVNTAKIQVIPDFMVTPGDDFEGHVPDASFMEYLSKHCVVNMNGKPEFETISPDYDSNYVLCNVRPIERKKLRYAQVVAKNLENQTGRKTYFVVTHGYGDEPDYFRETVKYARRLGLDYIYLPKLNGNYESFMTKMSKLRSIAFISSGGGGWENAINEAIFYKTPVYVNPELNSFPHLKDWGFQILSMNQNRFYRLITEHSPENMGSLNDPSLSRLVKGMDVVLSDRGKRKEVIDNNYELAKQYINADSPLIRDSIHNVMHRTSN